MKKNFRMKCSEGEENVYKEIILINHKILRTKTIRNVLHTGRRKKSKGLCKRKIFIVEG